MYKSGSILILEDGRTVNVFSVDKEQHKYTVINLDSDKMFDIRESDIFMCLVMAVYLIPTY